MPSTIGITGLKGEATLAGQHLVRVVFQLSTIPPHEWVVRFNARARELAQMQNHGIRPGFRFSYRVDGDSIQVSCPTTAFTTVVNGRNQVAQAVIDLVAGANLAAETAQAGSPGSSEAGVQEIVP